MDIVVQLLTSELTEPLRSISWRTFIPLILPLGRSLAWTTQAAIKPYLKAQVSHSRGVLCCIRSVYCEFEFFGLHSWLCINFLAFLKTSFSDSRD